MATTFGEEVAVSTNSFVGGGDDPKVNLKHSPFQEKVRFRLLRCASLPMTNDKGETSYLLVIKVMRLDTEGKDVCEERVFPGMLTKDMYDKAGNLIDRFTDINSFGVAILQWATAEGIVKGVEADKGKILVCHRIAYLKEDGKKATWVALAYENLWETTNFHLLCYTLRKGWK